MAQRALLHLRPERFLDEYFSQRLAQIAIDKLHAALQPRLLLSHTAQIFV